MPAHRQYAGFRGRPFVVHIFAAFLLFAPAAQSILAQDRQKTLDFDQAATFDQVWEEVRDNFWDADLQGVDWEAQRDRFRPLAVEADSLDEFARIINEMLATLNTSHTAYLPRTDPRRYQLLGIFDFIAPDDRSELFTYEGVGLQTTEREGKLFVTAVYEGFPAYRAGLRFGDELVSVAGQPFHPIQSFQGKAGEMVSIAFRRAGPDAEVREIEVAVESVNGRTMFERALTESARIIEQDDSSIGYVHVWNYAGRKYHDQLTNLVLWGKLSTCDALIVDLRDGWGGANVDYVNLFREPLVSVASQGRQGDAMSFTGVWERPVVLLVNRRSRSGKELLTFAFKKLGLGEVIGEKTAGAVVAGRCSLLENGDVLYLAVADLKIDGERLEGQGVAPTIEVDRPLPYAAGADPQLDRAIEVLVKKLTNEEEP